MEITEQQLHEMKIIADNISSTIDLIRKNNPIADDRSKMWYVRVVNSQCNELKELNDQILNSNLSDLKI